VKPVATRTTKVPKELRVRRNPEDGEREILDAAERLLEQRDFRDLTVDEVMSGTGMVRSAFYTYFENRNGLAMRLLQRIEAEMMEASATWLEQPLDDPAAGIEAGLLEVAVIYARHGRVLRAIHEASYHDREVELYYRRGLIQNFIEAVATRIREENEAGRADVEDPDAVARALLTLNANLFVERLGGGPDADSPEAVAATLALIWRRTIYPAR
jgi:AcrR family transcriptional regulator